jgi:hypothetical protein
VLKQLFLALEKKTVKKKFSFLFIEQIVISGKFPISGGSLADLTNSAQADFCLADLAEFWRFWSLH